MGFTRRELLAGSLALPLARAAENRPNILLIVANGVPAWMLGCYGNQEIRTPNLDALARLGTRFAYSYTCAPADSPARAALFTGRVPRQTGIQESLAPEPAANPPGQTAAPPSFSGETMISDILAAQGYKCGYAGRWALGNDTQQQHHFDFWYTPPAEEAQYQDALLSTKACEFLKQQAKGQPFFLTLSYTSPRRPYEGYPKKYYDLYAKATFEKSGRDPAASNALRNKDLLQDIVGNLRKCAAAVTAMDDQILLVRDCLHDEALRNNTIVIVTSDTGSLFGQHGLWGRGHASDPLNMYEEVMRVPMIWSWFGPVPPESVRPELISSYDLLPTICEVAGAAPPADRNLCGRSYLPLVTNKPFPKKQPWRNVVFGQLGSTEMVRDTRYKLILRDQGKGPGELYDLRADPRERANQYDNEQFVTVRDRLANELASWRKKYS